MTLGKYGAKGAPRLYGPGAYKHTRAVVKYSLCIRRSALVAVDLQHNALADATAAAATATCCTRCVYNCKS